MGKIENQRTVFDLIRKAVSIYEHITVHLPAGLDLPLSHRKPQKTSGLRESFWTAPNPICHVIKNLRYQLSYKMMYLQSDINYKLVEKSVRLVHIASELSEPGSSAHLCSTSQSWYSKRIREHKLIIT